MSGDTILACCHCFHHYFGSLQIIIVAPRMMQCGFCSLLLQSEARKVCTFATATNNSFTRCNHLVDFDAGATDVACRSGESGFS